MQKPILVIMAAGMGSRYGGLKQVDPVGPDGETIMDYSIYDAKRAGFETVVFIIKSSIADEFKEKIGNKIEKHMEVRYAYQELDKLPEGYEVPEGRQKPWGTGHALLSAKDQIDAPFAVINADDFYGATAFAEIYNYLSSTPIKSDGKFNLCMVGFELQNTISYNGSVSRGVCRVSNDLYLEDIVERSKIEPYKDGIHYLDQINDVWLDLESDTIVSMNLWGLNPEILDLSEDLFKDFLETHSNSNPLKSEFYLPSIIETLLNEGKARVKILKSSSKWYGVTYKEDKPAVQMAIKSFVEDGIYPPILWN